MCRLSIEVDIAVALDSGDEARLRGVVSTAHWRAEDPACANRTIQRIALYGHFGRTERYRDIVEQIIAAGVVPNLASCALLVRHGAPMTIEATVVLEDVEALEGFVVNDPALLDGQGHESPLGYAIHAWRPASLRCLIQSGARPDAENWVHIERIAGVSSTLVSELQAITQREETHDP